MKVGQGGRMLKLPQWTGKSSTPEPLTLSDPLFWCQARMNEGRDGRQAGARAVSKKPGYALACQLPPGFHGYTTVSASQ